MTAAVKSTAHIMACGKTVMLNSILITFIAMSQHIQLLWLLAAASASFVVATLVNSEYIQTVGKETSITIAP